MNAYARNSNLQEPRLVDDADASRGSVAAEEDLASLPTLPRFPAKDRRPSNSTAANAAEMASPPTASPLELSLEQIAEHAAPAPMPHVAPAPVAAVPRGVTPPGASKITPAGAAERYLAEATLELEAGQVDQPLWMRAVTQANGDEATARSAYLKARATAIRMARREVPHERAECRTRALGELHPEPRATVAGRGFAGLVTRNRIIAAAVGGAIVLAGAWFALSDPEPSRAIAAAAPQKGANSPSGAAKPPGQVAAAGATAGAAESQVTQAQALATKVAELSAAGNWNVLVLHAAEWTRKDPNNPEAWLALGSGFARLKQHAEAAEALATATTLAPERPEIWRGLGAAKAAWGATDEAIVAFERAVAMDDRDIASIVQIGLLQAGTGDFAKAKDTLDRALALHPADVEALCGSAAVAQKSGRAKDAQAHARQAASLGAACPEVAPEAPPTPVRVVGGKPPATPAITRH
jgi:tetratricopeptide (TPR) repeat protein